MGKNLTKKQHYVWKAYLRSWSKNDLIPTLFLNKKKVETTNLINVAQKRFFYRFDYLNHNEIAFLRAGIEDAPEEIRTMLNNLVDIPALLKTFENHPNKTAIDRIEKNGFESFHTMVESQGKKLIKCRTIKDLKLFEIHLDKTDALIYLTLQYFRTNKRRNDIKRSKLSLSDVINFDKIFPIMSIIMALEIAYKLSMLESISYTILEIKNDSNFITSDQPVVNLLSHLKDEQGLTKELEYYYPLTPKHSIKINFNSDKKAYNLIHPS